jgi:hypothetical protein
MIRVCMLYVYTSRRHRRSAKEKIMPNPLLEETFVVNSEPHTGARPSARLRVGLINTRPVQGARSKKSQL